MIVSPTFSQALEEKAKTEDYLVQKNSDAKPVRAAGEEDLGWNFYFPDIVDVDEKVEPEQILPQVASAPSKPKSMPMSVEWFREHYPTIRDRAINNPTRDNLAAELFAQKVMFDKSEVYSRKRNFVQSTDPYLQEGNRLPMFGTAATAMLSESNELKSEAISEVFEKTGLLVFYDHECVYCRKMVAIINSIDSKYPHLDMRVMARNAPKPDVIPGLKPNIRVYPDEFFRLSENLPEPIQHWPAFILSVPPSDYYIIAQGAVPRTELFNRILNVAFEKQVLGKNWYDKIYKNQRGLIGTSQYAALSTDLEGDPVKLINAVVEMIKTSDGSLYDEMFDNQGAQND